MQWKSMAVFCGSRAGANPLYADHARRLGALMAEHNLAMIYGGGSKGLMGEIANTMMAKGGRVVGVIPELLVKWEAQHTGLTELHVVDDMHARKKLIYELCDAAIVLPGGYGTLDEVFEMLTWNTLQIHSRKIFILNTAGFYDHLVDHIDHLFKQEFLYEEWQERITVVPEPDAIFSFPGKNQYPS